MWRLVAIEAESFGGMGLDDPSISPEAILRPSSMSESWTLQYQLHQHGAADRPRLEPGQLSKSKLTFPSCSLRRALKGWPDFDLKPFKTEVFPSRSSAFAVRLEIRLPDIVFQIVKLQPSRQ